MLFDGTIFHSTNYFWETCRWYRVSGGLLQSNILEPSNQQGALFLLPPAPGELDHFPRRNMGISISVWVWILWKGIAAVLFLTFDPTGWHILRLLREILSSGPGTIPIESWTTSCIFAREFLVWLNLIDPGYIIVVPMLSQCYPMLSPWTRILVRAVGEGATLVMRAINTNQEPREKAESLLGWII